MRQDIADTMIQLVKEMNQDEELVASYFKWKEENERFDKYLEEVKAEAKTGITKLVVSRMHNENIPIETISKCTDLTIDEVKNIIDNNK